MSDELTSLRSSIAANQMWATVTDRTAATEPARQAFMSRFEREVDPDETLDPALRAKLADNARRAYFQRLALESAKVRRAKKKRRLNREAIDTYSRIVAEAAEVIEDEGGRIA